MTQVQRRAIENLRKQNYSYACIAKKIGMSPNTVKSICRRKNIVPEEAQRKTMAEKAEVAVCKNCGNIMYITENSHREFCRDNCRSAYWKKTKKAARQN